MQPAHPACPPQRANSTPTTVANPKYEVLSRYVWETADAASATGGDSAEKLLERLGFPYSTHQKQVSTLHQEQECYASSSRKMPMQPGVPLQHPPEAGALHAALQTRPLCVKQSRHWRRDTFPHHWLRCPPAWSAWLGRHTS